MLLYDDDVVVYGDESVFFVFGSFVDDSYGLIVCFVMWFVVVGVIFGIVVLKVIMKFVYDVCLCVVCVYEEGFVVVMNYVFFFVLSVLNVKVGLMV